jgi:hypothetical protein
VTPEPDPSACVPQNPFVAQPAFQPAVEYVPAEAGKVTVDDGAAVSTIHV